MPFRSLLCWCSGDHLHFQPRQLGLSYFCSFGLGRQPHVLSSRFPFSFTGTSIKFPWCLLVEDLGCSQSLSPDGSWRPPINPSSPGPKLNFALGPSFISAKRLVTPTRWLSLPFSRFLSCTLTFIPYLTLGFLDPMLLPPSLVYCTSPQAWAL